MDQREEFWQLINPELNETVQVDRVLAFLTMFVQLSIDMRYTIEVLGGDANQFICDYLKRVDPEIAREDLAANLLGFPSNDQMIRECHPNLTKTDVFDLVTFENTMSTLGIRLKLLHTTEETQPDLIEVL